MLRSRQIFSSGSEPHCYVGYLTLAGGFAALPIVPLTTPGVFDFRFIALARDHGRCDRRALGMSCRTRFLPRIVASVVVAKGAAWRRIVVYTWGSVVIHAGQPRSHIPNALAWGLPWRLVWMVWVFTVNNLRQLSRVHWFGTKALCFSARAGNKDNVRPNSHHWARAQALANKRPE